MAGFFGKLPDAGDFVARGHAPGVRPVLDRFLSDALAMRARIPEAWPEGGLVAVIHGPASPLLLLVLPSVDGAGRAFPLSAVEAANGADHRAAEAWATSVFRPLVDAADGVIGAGELEAALAVIPPPSAADCGETLEPPQIWAEGLPPAPVHEGLERIFEGAA